MKFKVTFEDVIEAETEEDAYDEMIKYCYEIGFNADVTAFNFEEIKQVTSEALTESVLEDISNDYLEDK